MKDRLTGNNIVEQILMGIVKLVEDMRLTIDEGCMLILRKIEKRRIQQIINMLKERRPDLFGQILTVRELAELVVNMEADQDYCPKCRVYYIIPIILGNRVHSLVIDELGFTYVEKKPKEIIDAMVFHTTGLKNYKMMADALRMIINDEKIAIMPFAHTDYSLFPTGAPGKDETIWINPGHVEDITEEKNQAGKDQGVITAVLGLKLMTDKTAESLKIRMKIALRAQGIYKRDKRLNQANFNAPLQPFLGVNSTKMVKELIGEMTLDQVSRDPNMAYSYEHKALLQDYESGKKSINEYLGTELTEKELAEAKKDNVIIEGETK